MTLTDPTIERAGDTFVLTYTDVYATDPADLWDAITTPARLRRWMADYQGDFRLSGTWEVLQDGEHWCTGTVTACDAPRGFTTTWHAVGEEPTELSVSLEPTEGGTRLTLRHVGIQSIFYGAGWQTYLEQLVRHLAGPADATRDADAWQARFAELSPGYALRFDHLR